MILPLGTRANATKRWLTMARVALRMMFHDKLKMLGTMSGVIFAVVLSNQQAGTFLGLMQKNTMYVDNSNADLWILPANTETIQPGKMLSDSVLMQAKVTPGVAWAEPLLFGQASVALPSGGTQSVTLIGTRHPAWRGGPWNLVQGTVDELAAPDTMIFEDADREILENLNLGSIREVNGRKIRAGGFTFGLIPFGPSYSFAELELARALMNVAADQMSFVLVGIEKSQDIERIRAELSSRLPQQMVLTRPKLRSKVIEYVLTKTAIGITLGTSAVFGLVIGFVIVSLSMFSGVVDNIREFGTLKALGATNTDLARLLFVQSVAYGAIGSVIGLALVTRVAEGIRSAKLALNFPPELFIATTLIMILMCVFASSLALFRLRKVEPAMVFR